MTRSPSPVPGPGPGPTLPLAAEKYLAELAETLDELPPDPRQEALADVRAYLEDAVLDGRDLAATLTELGPAAQLGRDYLTVDSRSSTRTRAPGKSGTGSERSRPGGPESGAAHGGLGDWAAGWLSRAALALSVLTAVVVVVLLPFYEETVETSDGVSTGVSRTLLEGMGLAASLVTLVPAVLLALPLVAPRRWATRVRLGAAIAVTVFCVLGILSIGMLYLPTVGLAWTAVLAPGVVATGPNGRRSWRIVAAVLLVVPFVLLAISMLSGTFGSSAGAIAMMVAAVVLATAVGAGRAWAYLVAMVGGLVLLIMAVVWGGMLVLGVWLVGGLWFDVGLAATVVHSAVRRSSTHRASAPGDPRA